MGPRPRGLAHVPGRPHPAAPAHRAALHAARAGDAASHVVRGTGSLAWKHPARVRLHAPVEVVAERITPAGGLLRPVDEHSCVLDTGGGSLRDLVGYLTSLDVAFEVLDPPELRTLLRELAERYAAAAGDPDAPVAHARGRLPTRRA